MTEAAAIIAGLERAKAQGPGPAIASRKGKKAPVELRLSPEWFIMLSSCKHAASVCLGRPVSATLVFRRALELYAAHLAQVIPSATAQAEEAAQLKRVKE